MDRTDRHQWKREPCEQSPKRMLEQDLEQDVVF